MAADDISLYAFDCHGHGKVWLGQGIGYRVYGVFSLLMSKSPCLAYSTPKIVLAEVCINPTSSVSL